MRLPGIQGTDLALASGATAIVAYNDLVALSVLSRLAARDIQVPQDVSVVGFDDLLFASMCTPPLTTVSMPIRSAPGSNAGRAMSLFNAPSADKPSRMHAFIEDRETRGSRHCHTTPCGCSFTRLTSCVGFTKRSAIRSQTNVTAM
jgi:Periplasmic binding protein-like domain